MKTKKPDIFFEKRGGFGPLAIYWEEGPYGEAVEAIEGNGIGFFDPIGNLLAVQFDMIQSNSDHQSLRFDLETIVKIKVKKGKVVYLKKPIVRKLAA